MPLLDETLEGRRAVAQEYTDQWVSMNGNFLVHRQTKIARVIALPGGGLSWFSGHRPKDGVIFEGDDVCVLGGIGDVTAKKLKYFGWVTMVEHTGFLDKDIETLSEVNGMSVGILQAGARAGQDSGGG